MSLQNKQALTLLLSANVVSGFAQGISMLAIPWYFASILKQPSTFGIAYGVITFFSIFWNLYCGTLIDKYPRKNLFLIISVVAGTVLATISAVGFYGYYF